MKLLVSALIGPNRICPIQTDLGAIEVHLIRERIIFCVTTFSRRLALIKALFAVRNFGSADRKTHD